MPARIAEADGIGRGALVGEYSVKFADWYLLLTLCCGAALLATGCGGDDTCGFYSTGTVVIVDECEFNNPTPHPADSR